MSADVRPRLASVYQQACRRIASCLILVVYAALSLSPARSATTQDLFRLFTQHIQKQVATDKQAFAETSRCTELFYKRQRHKPLRPQVQGVVWLPSDHSSGLGAARPATVESDCERLYPRGLEDVREAFSRTQSTLSLSLTFYEFALVSDGNDDREYNATELRDLLRSLDLASDPSFPATTHLAALTETFDSFHHDVGLERLMTSMGRLYDQGYRFTRTDQAELHRVME